MLPLHDLRNSSTMSCHDHILPNMHCFGCCQYSPRDVSTLAHEETPIVSSYILGDLDAFLTLHDSHDFVHHMHSMNHNDIVVPHTSMLNLYPHRVLYTTAILS